MADEGNKRYVGVSQLEEEAESVGIEREETKGTGTELEVEDDEKLSTCVGCLHDWSG